MIIFCLLRFNAGNCNCSGWVANKRVNGVLGVARAFGDIEYKTLKDTCWGKTFRSLPRFFLTLSSLFSFTLYFIQLTSLLHSISLLTLSPHLYHIFLLPSLIPYPLFLVPFLLSVQIPSHVCQRYSITPSKQKMNSWYWHAMGYSMS